MMGTKDSENAYDALNRTKKIRKELIQRGSQIDQPFRDEMMTQVLANQEIILTMLIKVEKP